MSAEYLNYANIIITELYMRDEDHNVDYLDGIII